MSRQSRLCVGGPLHGKRITILHGAGFMIPVVVDPAHPDRIPHDPMASVPIEFAHYRAQHFEVGGPMVMTFWVPATQTPAQTLQLLADALETTVTTIGNKTA